MRASSKALAVALVMLVSAGVASASTAWVQYVGVQDGVGYGGGSASKQLSTIAGAYKLNVDLNGTPITHGSGVSVLSFCVDVWDYSTTAWQVYSRVSLDFSPDAPGSSMGAAKAKDITQLLRLAYGSNQLGTNTGTQSSVTASNVQAAIWEIINETGAYGIGDGTWKTTSGGGFTLAQGWLSTINLDTADSLAQYGGINVLQNSSYQDFAIVMGSGGDVPVPEPLTMISAFFAIGGLGTYLRKRIRATVA